MDKVIIDGVDVSECDFLVMRDDQQKCECCHATGFGVICDCEMWKTCYYKQLQRLKEEITKLSDPRYQISKVNEGYYNRMNTYKQALQEIRDKILSPEIIDEETKKLHTSEELDNIVRWHREDKLSKIQDKINEVIGAE